MDGINRVGGEFGWPYNWRITNVTETTTAMRTVDGVEHVVTAKSSLVPISINDIPENRFADARRHLFDHYLEQDHICKRYNLKKDQTAVNNFYDLWTHILNQKMSIGAFRVNEDGSLGELVGVNLLYVSTDEKEKWIIDHATKSKSATFFNMLSLFREMSTVADICRKYGVNKYLASMGLSLPSTGFNVQQMTAQLLETMSDIGHAYGITVGSKFFTDRATRFRGRQAGFETVFSMKYVELSYEDGSLIFPDSLDEEVHLMTKSLVKRVN